MLDVTDPGTPAEPTPAAPAVTTGVPTTPPLIPAGSSLQTYVAYLVTLTVGALLAVAAPAALRLVESPFAAVAAHEASLSQLAVAVSLYGEQLASLVEDVADTKVDDAKCLDQLAQAVNLYGVRVATLGNDASIARDQIKSLQEQANGFRIDLTQLADKVPPPAPPAPPKPPVTPAYAGPLFPVLVLTDPPTPEQAALRTDQSVRSACESRDCEFRSYLVTQSEVKDGHWTAAVDEAGGPPVVLWLTPSGVRRVTKAPDAAKVVDDLKGIRGK